ncbi:hypothetical protein GBA52_010505 [Prunus armeniaca]|nr:hypothetical protein GBA52_010505 [Prunus armeniaca]
MEVNIFFHGLHGAESLEPVNLVKHTHKHTEGAKLLSNMYMRFEPLDERRLEPIFLFPYKKTQCSLKSPSFINVFSNPLCLPQHLDHTNHSNPQPQTQFQAPQSSSSTPTSTPPASVSMETLQSNPPFSASQMTPPPSLWDAPCTLKKSHKTLQLFKFNPTSLLNLFHFLPCTLQKPSSWPWFCLCLLTLARSSRCKLSSAFGCFQLHQ